MPVITPPLIFLPSVPEVFVGLGGQLTGRLVSSCLFFKRKNVGPAVKHCGFTKLTLIRRLMRDREVGGNAGLYVHIVQVKQKSRETAQTHQNVHTWSRLRARLLFSIKELAP